MARQGLRVECEVPIMADAAITGAGAKKKGGGPFGSATPFLFSTMS